MIYIEEAIKQFKDLPIVVQVEFGKQSIINIVKSIEVKYEIALSSLIIYIAIDELKTSEEMSDFLVKEYDIDKEKAKEIIREIDQNVLHPIVDKLLFLSSDPNKPMTILREKEIAARIFKEELIEELDNIFIVVEEFNLTIFYILAHDLNFKKELENALYSNQEKITSKEFILDNKQHSPSIANWLKDFIQKNGSQMFDNLVLSQYIVNSENAKKLDIKEKDLLRKLLVLYRNLKFFPDSMPSDDGEGWEIIPTDKQEEDLTKVEKDPVLPKSKEEKRQEELRALANQYPENSLERKAVEEEIKKK
ncbi:MAG: hypothetical protein ABH818_03160 [Patescibacteria group bacterium]|nr:hypothetical protein [Patescibacteria group bacterium]MBU1870781.1 hypothetical protein [Patescibacteria group bacterium]